MTTHDDEAGLIVRSNQAFYRAFRERDLDRMEAIWAQSSPVACAHPGMDVIIGRNAVMTSWRRMLEHRESPRLHCGDVKVHRTGDFAFVTCVEGTLGDPPALLATNVFVKEDGQWKMVHHHAGALSGRHREPVMPQRDPSTLN